MPYILEEPWNNLAVTTGTFGGAPSIVLLDPEDEPIAFLDHAEAANLAYEILRKLAEAS